MIVDDHGAVRRGLRCLVESEGRYEIVGEAADGNAALQVAREARPDLVILDYSLPFVNGIGVVHYLKRLAPKIEILLYTLHDGPELMLELLKAGIRAYVPKTEPGSNLLAALEALSQGRTYFSGMMADTLLNHVLAPSPDEATCQLTIRERVVAQQIAEGRLNKQVAHSLGLSIKTVESHRSNIMHKLNLKSTAELVRYAIRSHLVMA
jgi:DNA-binding NarL/FixJ family response regulator